MAIHYHAKHSFVMVVLLVGFTVFTVLNNGHIAYAVDSVSITFPSDEQVVNTDTFTITGTASDKTNGIDKVGISIDGGTGNFRDIFVISNAELIAPLDLVFGPDDNLYVSSEGTNEVLRYNGITGEFIDTFVVANSGGLDNPIGLVFGPDDNLYVSSQNTDEVLRYNGITGEFIDTFVVANSGGLDAPLDLVFGPDDNLYVSSQNTDEVLRYNGITGEFIDTFVVANSGGLDNPNYLVFSHDNNLYVSSANTDEVLRYNGITGEFIDTFVVANSGGLDNPIGLVFGPDDNLYVSSGFTDEVLRYNGITGEFIDTFVVANSGGLDAPFGLIFSHDNNLYVSSAFTDEVLRYDPFDDVTGTTNWTFLVTNLSEGNHIIHVRAIDNEGGTSIDTTSITITIDELDVLTSNNKDNVISLLAGNGDGTFDLPTEFQAGNNPNKITSGDLNRDNILDIVAINGNVDGDRTLSILFGNIKDTFGPRIILDLGYEANSVAIGDFNDDNNNDLFVSDWSGNSGTSVQILLGDGDGGFCS